MTDFCVLSKHKGFNKHIWQSFDSWRARDDTVCANNMLSLQGKQVYSIIQLIDYSQDTCYPTRENGRRTQRIRVGPGISSRQRKEPSKRRWKGERKGQEGNTFHWWRYIYRGRCYPAVWLAVTTWVRLFIICIALNVCPGCLSQIPMLHKQQKEMAELDILLIYLWVDHKVCSQSLPVSHGFIHKSVPSHSHLKLWFTFF